LPTVSRQENATIKLFVSAYENDTWKDSNLIFPDELEDGQVDGFATRATDQATLAIEHTVVEPFLGDILDQSEFIPEFIALEKDTSLHVANVWIQIFVPVRTLHLQKRPVRDAIVRSIAEWLRSERLRLTIGNSKFRCPISGIEDKSDFSVELTVKVTSLAGNGSLQIRRQQTEDTLGEVIEKMLRKKLPKLVKTAATKRVLLLERRHLNLHPKSIYDEIEIRRDQFPELAHVNEIWIVEKMPFFRPGDAHFELYKAGECIRSFGFYDGELRTRSEDGIPAFIPPQ
jgi:hypothetical protein